MLVPINVPDDIMHLLAMDFGSQVGGIPFTYLGLPSGTTIYRVLVILCH
jgi:hypothetical protein